MRPSFLPAIPATPPLPEKRALLAYHQARADEHGFSFINLLESPPDETLLSSADLPDYLALRALPWRRDEEGIIIAASDVSEWTHRWARSCYGGKVRIALTSPYDMRRTLEKHFLPQLTEQSRMALYRAAPALSARHTLSRTQAAIFASLGTLGVMNALIAPGTAASLFVLGMHLIYALNMAFKTLLFSAGRQAALPPAFPLLSDDELPVYSVLVPLYREVASLPRLLNALSHLDYPAHKLDIKLVLEEDDRETYGALAALKPDHRFDIIRVPPSLPRTKPKALNYALRFARGRYVTIYDAEDQPHARQLRDAASAFHHMPPDVACLQARLNYYNPDTNLLTRWFALEYAILFNATLPGLEALKLPIPLGGTSNHFDLSHLRKLGEWDPFNVTEDADLGMRLAAQGLRTLMLSSFTLEEAPVSIATWLRQRSRWIKGYMQTWLVHMRAPAQLWRAVGTRGFLGFQCFIGLPALVFLTAPLVWALTLANLTYPALLPMALPEWFMPLSFFNLACHFVLHWWQGLRIRHTVPPVHWDRLACAIFFLPFYWLLHSLASYRAFWQLIRRPHFWDKTDHGHALVAR